MAAAITITSKQEGFRRCGVAHSAEPTEYPADRFSAAELKQLQSEPLLLVETIEQNPEKKQTPPDRPNVKESVKRVNAAGTIAELDELAEDETRKGVTDAIAKRREELTEEK